MKNYCCFYATTLLSTQPRQVVVARTAPKSFCFNLLGRPRTAIFSHHQVKWVISVVHQPSTLLVGVTRALPPTQPEYYQVLELST